MALEYVSKQYDVPLEYLLVINEHERHYPSSERVFQAFTILDTRPTTERLEYLLLIDKKTKGIEENMAAVQEAENAAQQAKFGKLHPALYERLQTVKDDELLPVAIWVAPGQTRTRDQVYEELTAHYPQARQAREQGKAPWDVSDKGLAEEILGAYRKMRLEDTQARIGPLVEALTAERIAVKTFGELPSISALLSKARIVELAKREDVQIIYLIEEQGAPEMNTAATTDRVSGVWQQGINGSNVDIAILENGNIDTSVTCLSVIATRLITIPVEGHMTRVASVAACDADPYRGIAYNADLISASFVSGMDAVAQQDAMNALQWALDAPRNADVVSMSYRFEQDNNFNWSDRAVDYWVRERNAVFVISAGNNQLGDYVIISPGKAWNVITVGGINDHSTSLWQDDVMWEEDPNTSWHEGSSYINPPGGDREKPEVAAPAVDITTITAGGTPYTSSGTSYAAPQVAGLAALLIDRSVALKTRPNAVKAIIMASAVHNVHRPSDIPVPADPNYPDLRDGAGAIDATLADQIAGTECLDYGASRVPCWWHSDEVYIPDNLQWSENRYFYASAGEKIRIALSWYSDSDGGPPAYADVLGMNLNLLVYFQDSLGFYQHIKSSASIDNNYELLEFTAPRSAKYKIWITRPYGDAGSETYNSFAVAWTKTATYLPDVRHNDNNWNSTIVIRNDSAEPRDVRITYFNANGDNLGYVNYPGLASGAVWQRTADWSGSAIVDASEDVSVMVNNVNTSTGHTYSYNGIAAADPLNPGWGQVGTDIHLPLLMNASNGWSSSVTIFNAGSIAATISLDYDGQGSGGPYAGPQNVSLGPNASVTYDQSGSACPLVGAGRVRSSNGQPLAVTVRQVHSGGPTMAYNGLRGLSRRPNDARMDLTKVWGGIIRVRKIKNLAH